jgi:signal peptidase
LEKFFKVIRLLIAQLATLYLSAIACLALWVFIPMVILWTPTVVVSGSMEPSVMTGDVVSAQKVSTDQVLNGAIKPGMVILAVDPAKPDSLYTHRVIKINSDKSMVTKGDANSSADALTLPAENVRGIEKLRIPFIGLPTQKMKTGDTVGALLLGASVLLAFIISSSFKNRQKKTVDVDSTSSQSLHTTRAENRIVDTEEKRNKRKDLYALAASIVAVVLVSIIGSSSATYTGSVKQLNDSWSAAAVFPAPDPKVAMCGGAVYTGVPGTTVTCSVGTVAGTTTSYTLTVTGTGALTQWSVTADWTGYLNWYKGKAFGPGVADTGDIMTRNGYQIKGLVNGSVNPADSWNHAWVSSTKAAETFTVQVTTK